MSPSLKSSPEEPVPEWVPVSQGLFHYPLRDGEEPALLANQCSTCGRTFFPKRNLCPDCFEKSELKEILLDRFGVIYACTVVSIPSPVGIQAPYVYGYVDIPKNQVRIFGLFSGEDPSSFAVGQKVELVLEPIRKNPQGQKIIGYKFKQIS
jgi:hypothetical protein